MENQVFHKPCVFTRTRNILLLRTFINDGEKSSRIAFPHLPDDYAPEMTIVQGEQANYGI